MRILVVEDDAAAARYIRRGLSESGHLIDCVGDGDEGLAMAQSGNYDVLVIDRMLPGRDGLSLVAALRAAANQTPVLFLSALGEVGDRVKGLRTGGDDYLVKPFAFAELLARVEALARRAEPGAVQLKLQIADLELDMQTRQVARAGRRIDLQPREFRLLEYLMRHAGHVVTRTMLLENVWEYHFDP